MPRLHSEDLNIQTGAISLFECWTDPKTVAVSKRNRETIATYGCFPHRDVIPQRKTDGLL